MASPNPFRQAVIELGSWTVKAGLWEQTFLPTTVYNEERKRGDGHDTNFFPVGTARLRKASGGRTRKAVW